MIAPRIHAAGLVVALVCVSGIAFAANVVPVAPAEPAPRAEPGEPSRADLRELARLLADERVRAWLEREAEQARSPDRTAAISALSPQEWLGARLAVLESNVVRALDAWSDPSGALRELRDAWRGAVAEGETLRSLVYVLVFLIVGAGLEWLFWRYAQPLRARIEASAHERGGAGLSGTALRALLTLLGITLFSVGTLGTFVSFDWPAYVEVPVLSLLLAVVAVRVLNTLVVLVLCPRVARLRPVPLSTPVARFAYRWTMAAATIAAVGILATEAIDELGIAPRLALLSSTTTALALAVVLAAAIWRYRRLFGTPSGERGSRRALLADVVPVFATFLLGLALALWVAGARGLFWTLVAIVAVPVADRGARAVIRASGPPSGRTYGPVLERLVRFALVVAAVPLVGAAWGLDLARLSGAETAIGRSFEAVVDVLVAYLIADLAWVWARTAIDARMAAFVPPEPGHAPGPEARLATLLPLVRKVLLVSLFAMVVLVALSSLGINVGPLIAGAGVVGIAIGFGAQTLVRDIVSGVFFLLDDAFRVGEYIEVGELRGTVESISVRSIRLRHHRGAVHTIPFGEMKSLTNHSRDWVIMKLEFRVPFDTDLGLVKKLVKRIGADLAAHPELGEHIIEPLKSQGVRRMEEFNMVVGVKFMAKPGEQWTIRKETYQRVRDAFEANGIGFAERNVKVEVIGADPDSPEVREAALGAAQQALEQQVGAPPAPGRAAP